MDKSHKNHSCHDHLTPADKHKGGHGNHDHASMMSDPLMAKKMEKEMRIGFIVSLFLTIPVVLYSSLGQKILGVNLPTPLPASLAFPDGGINLLSLLLASLVVFWPGWIFISGAYYSLKKKTLDMSTLIATGVLAAYIYSFAMTIFADLKGETFFEAAAMLVTFVLFGHWMEMRSRRGTSDALRALFDLVPPQARVIRPANSGIEIVIPSSEIRHNDIVIIKPGDKIPVDGIITEGETAIDESLITGESIPLSKKTGDKVIGGSVNQTGLIKFKAVQIGSETVLAQIIKMVETAQNSKAPGQRIADKAAGWLVALAIGSGLAAFLGWYFYGGASLFTALTFAISAVVIACPDALGLATPTVVAVGTGIGAKHNILIKDAATLENASKINTIVIDKTGTLTEGKPKVTDIAAYNGFSAEEVLKYEANVEAGSNHPLAKAILDEAKKKGTMPSKPMEKFESFAGLGIKAQVNGKVVLVGKEKLLQSAGVDISAGSEIIKKLVEEGKTLSLLAVDGIFAGLVAAADMIKPTAKLAISELKAMGIEAVMITGDHIKVAEVVGGELGIEKYHAEVLPQDKAGHIKRLQGEGKFVAMVGDGINDAPALAQSDIGIAIGAGTDVAKETGNIVLMKSDPLDIVAAIRLSKATVRKMKQNLFWAAIYNILAIPVAAGVFYNSLGWQLRPEISALLMSVSSIIVATNAVLLKRIEPKLKTFQSAVQ